MKCIKHLGSVDVFSFCFDKDSTILSFIRKTDHLFLPGICWPREIGNNVPFLRFCPFDHCSCCFNSSIFWIFYCTLPTSPSSSPPTGIISSAVTFDHVKVKSYPMETTSCLSLKLLIPSAMYSHPPSHWNSAQLTQTGTDIGASAITAGWSVISGVPDQIAPFTVCMKSHRQWQKEGQSVWGVRYQKVFK